MVMVKQATALTIFLELTLLLLTAEVAMAIFQGEKAFAEKKECHEKRFLNVAGFTKFQSP